MTITIIITKKESEGELACLAREPFPKGRSIPAVIEKMRVITLMIITDINFVIIKKEQRI